MRRKADPQLILDQLAHGLGAAVAQMIDVIGVLNPIVHLNDVLHQVKQILLGQGTMANRQVELQLPVDLVTPHLAQVVAARAEQQRLEIALGVVEGGRIAGAHLAIELGKGLGGRLGGVVLQSRLDVGMIRR